MAKNKNKNKPQKAQAVTPHEDKSLAEGGIGDGVGTSAFTHQDDLGAEVHPSDPTHHERLFYGGEVPRKSELQEVVLGPAAYGSPDPRTLGHKMQPVSGAPASAPELSEDYAGGKRVAGVDDAGNNSSTSSEKTWKKSDNKETLLEEADARGLDVTEENTKDEIIEALEADDSANEADEDETDDNEDEK